MFFIVVCDREGLNWP